MTARSVLVLAAIAAAIVIVPHSAFAFRALNRLEVNPVGPSTFEVIARPGASNVDVWCAAGDYALRVLGARGVDRVYLVAGRQAAVTRANRYGVTFSMAAPPEAAELTRKPLTLDLRNIGDSLSAAFAQQYCYGYLEDKRRFFP